MIVDSRNKGRWFFPTVLTPPQPSTPKMGFKWEAGGEGGVALDQKIIGDAFIGQNKNSFYKRLIKQFNPLRLGTRIGPKSGGGNVVLSSTGPLYAPACL